MSGKPELILFDYGQTIIEENGFDSLKGNQALLDCAVRNPNHVTAAQVQELADELSRDMLGAFNAQNRNDQPLELTGYAFNNYLYDYLEIEFSLTPEERQWVFWNNSASGRPSRNIENILEYLHQSGIRTAVVSNIMQSTECLRRRINELLPENHFEFIIASSDYLFRKPHHRIFELALKKAKVPADKVWFCGDNLHCDIEGAYKAGMKPLWYPTYVDANDGMHTDVPYTRIDDWLQLIELLEH
jgi:putative hydrolase of the HAD superfamily